MAPDVVLQVWAYPSLRRMWKLLKWNTEQRSQAENFVHEFIFLNFTLEAEYCYSPFHMS